ncbi:uncharacterized protein EHS24_003701 [Apiotrichum porosum]|uniref:FAD/NAD(P)-binding domain-containing protein n=1 Tax=Apiotrichum porosum TaxID=105984 RepID=A0A427XEC8_9TREE|nr:uncharacterized protein EHS24_003701 [Apiotrichum porosum]RSH77074.1 hypothetical protein EHS24_003701 [Apiotrichum porosum]
MAPTAILERTTATAVDSIAELKAKIANGHATHPNGAPKSALVRDGPERKPVADDYMYDFKYNAPLPTLERLGTDFAEDTDAVKIAEDFLVTLQAAFADPAKFTSLFIEDGVWRDKIVFAWEYRTFNGTAKIGEAAKDLLANTPVANLKLLSPTPKVDRPYDDLASIQIHFSFDTDKVGASGVANVVKTTEGIKIWTLHTVIESLLDFPELPNRDGHMIAPVSWATQREQDTDFEGRQPDVVIVGGGHNGLMMAARFKALGVSAIIIERNERIGDNWRKRYESLSLHFPHWEDHFPYMPYPEHWPVYTPAGKLGEWLDWYASAMELYAWTSSSVTSCKQEDDGSWRVEVNRGGHGQRVLTPKHLVMATSLAGVPMSPYIPGQEEFKGTLRHSTTHDSSREWVGKKVLVVGTSSSGFDTAYDFARRGVDVTMLQRSPTYIMSLTHSVPRIIGIYEPDKNGKRPDLDECDRMAYSMPVGPSEELGRRLAEDLEVLDHDLLAAMEARGFQTWRGQRGTGTQTLGYSKNGGFYFDAGACERIINGDIKVEQGWIEKFDGHKTILNGGREKEYDLVILATGFSNTIDSVRATLGDDVADRCNDIWGVDEEGELKSAWRDCGVPNLWIMVGTLQHGRYHSKRVSLRIKAMLEGIAGEKYVK